MNPRFASFLVLASLTLASPAQETVKLRGSIADAGSGEAIPARLYIQSEKGEWFLAKSLWGDAVPYEKTRESSVEIHTSLSAHPFEVELPPGKYTLTAEHGKEYHSAQKTVTLTEKITEVELALDRWIDMNALGWFSGETHVHRSMEELPTLMLCENLNVAFPLTAWVSRLEDTPLKDNRNKEAVPPAELIKIDDTHVIWPRNTEYEINSVNRERHPLGALFVLNHQEELDLPALPVGAVVAEARKQGAMFDLDKQNWPWSMVLMPLVKVDLFELTNNHLWRTNFAFSTFFPDYVPDYMGVEMVDGGFTERGWIDFGLKTYYALLNCGFDMKPTGGTASGVHPVPLGFGRVFVKIDGPFSYESWVEGLRAGRSFVTTGPMLEVEFDGGDAGRRFALSEQKAKAVRIEGNVRSLDPLKGVEIVVNGDVVRMIPMNQKMTEERDYAAEFDVSVPIERSSWIAVRTFAKRADGKQRFAHTAPVHVEVADRPLQPKREEVEYLLGRVRDEINRHEGVLSEAVVEEFREAARFYESLIDAAR